MYTPSALSALKLHRERDFINIYILKLCSTKEPKEPKDGGMHVHGRQESKSRESYGERREKRDMARSFGKKW